VPYYERLSLLPVERLDGAPRRILGGYGQVVRVRREALPAVLFPIVVRIRKRPNAQSVAAAPLTSKVLVSE